MSAPTIYTAEEVVRCAQAVKCQLPDGRWVAARAEGWDGLYGLRLRFKCAWLVFTGRADALKWIGQPGGSRHD